MQWRCASCGTVNVADEGACVVCHAAASAPMSPPMPPRPPGSPPEKTSPWSTGTVPAYRVTARPDASAAPPRTPVTPGRPGTSGSRKPALVALAAVAAVVGLIVVANRSSDDVSTSYEPQSGTQEEAYEDCGSGNMEACDWLYRRSDLDSEFEHYGSTCGGIVSPQSGNCSVYDFDANEIEEYEGDDEPGGSYRLSSLRDACDTGDMESCDELYYDSPAGSADETFGSTCGGLSSYELHGRCEDVYG
jgi:hypothetical protein